MKKKAKKAKKHVAKKRSHKKAAPKGKLIKVSSTEKVRLSPRQMRRRERAITA